jgi:hypothetical protein
LVRGAFRVAAATNGDRHRSLVHVDDRFRKLCAGSRDLQRSFGKLSPEVS